MKVCLTCGIRLTDENRSQKQPDIRCKGCWPKFVQHIDQRFAEIGERFDRKERKP